MRGTARETSCKTANALRDSEHLVSVRVYSLSITTHINITPPRETLISSIPGRLYITTGVMYRLTHGFEGVTGYNPR